MKKCKSPRKKSESEGSNSAETRIRPDLFKKHWSKIFPS